MTRRGIQGGMLVVFGVLGLLVLLLAAPVPLGRNLEQGVSFSAPHAESIGLNWREAYEALLTDLGVKHLRLAAYWSEVEPVRGEFDFTGLDYQMNRAADNGAQVVLGVGRKLPRWPECHVPKWARELSEIEQQALVERLIERVVLRYREHPALFMWQLENEPLLAFGDCPPEDRDFLKQEENLLRSLDSTHPILITDSGELNSWLPAAAYGDILGTTMYRTVFSGRTNDLFHYDYIFPAWLYRLKARLVWLTQDKPVLISELQGEPWAARSFHEVSVEERRQSFSPTRFRELNNFARRTQLPKLYWWGAEYWYWEKKVNGEPVFWEMAKTFIR